jgi:hypothetical protein
MYSTSANCLYLTFDNSSTRKIKIVSDIKNSELNETELVKLWNVVVRYK